MPLDEVSGAALMFGGHAGAANLTAQSAPQKVLKKRMQAILFAAPVAGDGDEDVAPHQIGQHARAIRPGIKRRAGVKLNAIQQRNLQQQLAHVFGFVGKNFFGEVVKNIALRLS